MLRLDARGLPMTFIIIALVLFIPQFLVWSLPGSFELSELAACASLILLYKVFPPILGSISLSKLLLVGLVIPALVLLLSSLVVAPLARTSLGEALPPGIVEELRQSAGHDEQVPKEDESWVGGIDSLVRDGGEAIRNSGLFSGSGTFGNTLGAVGEVTSPSAPWVKSPPARQRY